MRRHIILPCPPGPRPRSPERELIRRLHASARHRACHGRSTPAAAATLRRSFSTPPESCPGRTCTVWPGLRSSGPSLRPATGCRLSLRISVHACHHIPPLAGAVPEEDTVVAVRADAAEGDHPGDRFPDTLVWIDSTRGEIVARRDPRHFSAGDTVWQWMHPLHSGEGFGPVGRLLVCLCGVLPVLLAVTGLWRWLDKRRARRRTAPRSPRVLPVSPVTEGVSR